MLFCVTRLTAGLTTLTEILNQSNPRGGRNRLSGEPRRTMADHHQSSSNSDKNWDGRKQ